MGPPPTDDLLDYLTCVDQQNHIAIGVTIETNDLKAERGVGIARLIRLPRRPDTAEMAISVCDDMQRRGIGAILLDGLIRAAKEFDIRVVHAEILGVNASMRAIFERAGASVSAEPPRDLQRPNYMSPATAGVSWAR